MTRPVSPVLLAIVGVLLICCCLATLFGVGLLGWTALQWTAAVPFSEKSEPPAVALVPLATRTPWAFGMNVGAYSIVIPTPSAPPLNYPIRFKSSLSIATYPVAGGTADELSRSLDAQALPDSHEKGTRYYARTDWRLDAKWNWKPTGRGCEVDDGDVSLAVTMTLPALVSSAELEPSVLQRWNTFTRNTIAHETGHVELDLRGARDYQRDLGNLPPASDCTALQTALKILFEHDFAGIDRANVDYDYRTQHGLKQGAVFP